MLRRVPHLILCLMCISIVGCGHSHNIGEKTNINYAVHNYENNISSNITIADDDYSHRYWFKDKQSIETFQNKMQMVLNKLKLEYGKDGVAK